MGGLQVIIGGGGICGLATAIALTQNGHHVTVYESGANVTSTVGAGLQVGSNMSRLLYKLGLEPYLKSGDVLESEAINFRRWRSGKIVGGVRTCDFKSKYGSPYLQVHRATLHEALYQRTKELQIPILVNSRVIEYDIDTPAVTLENGDSFCADLVVAADGMSTVFGFVFDIQERSPPVLTEFQGVSSSARSKFLDITKKPKDSAEYDAYRIVLETDALRGHDALWELGQRPQQNVWIGPNQHVITYPLRNASLLNSVWVSPRCAENDENPSIASLKEKFRDWDPILQNLLEGATSCGKWPICTEFHLSQTVSASGRCIIMGDAAHDMTPFLGQGSAMAVEDAFLLGLVTSNVTKQSELSAALDAHQELRLPRTATIRQEALRNVQLFHLPDGEKQERRDADASAQFSVQSNSMSPYILSDPQGQRWLYDYKIEHDLVEGSQAYCSAWV